MRRIDPVKAAFCLYKSIFPWVSTKDAPASTNARVVQFAWLTTLIIFAPLVDGGTTHLAVMVIRLLIIGLAAACLWTIGRRGACRALPHSLCFAIVGFLAWSAFSAITSPTIHQSKQWFVVLSLYAILFYSIVFYLTRWNDVFKLACLLGLMGLGEAMYALAQFGLLKQPRPSGTFFNPNFLAGYLVAVTLMLMGMGLYAKKAGPFQEGMEGRRKLSSVRPALWISISICLVVAIMTTGSRGALAAILVGMSFLLIVRFRWRGLAAMVAIILTLFVVPNPLSSRLQSEHSINPVAYARANMWMQAVQIMLDHPLGIGLGLYQYVYPGRAFAIEGEIARYGKLAQTPHNEFLQIGAELGIPGLLLFLVGLVGVAKEASAGLRRRMTRFNRGLAVGAAAATVSLLAHATVDSNFHEPALAVLLVFNVAVLCSLRSFAIRRGGAPDCKDCRPHVVWLIGGAVCLVWLATVTVQTGAAWFYFERGTVAQRHGDVENALQDYRFAVRLDPDKALYHSSLAAAQFQRFRQTGQGNDAQSAIDGLLDAIACNPIDGRLHGLLGHLYVTLADSMIVGGDPTDQQKLLRRRAIEAYEQARDLEPFSAMHRLELGRLYWIMEERQRGLEEVLQAIRIEPNFLPARAWLVKVYLTSKDLPDRLKAQQEFKEILERRHQYASAPKNELESMYLSVDVTELKAILAQARGSAS
jgi:O-antigen ligase